MTNKLELNWIGKYDPENRLNPEPRILIEKPEYSYFAEPQGQLDLSENKLITDNILIHGDNLLALKSLQQEFAGRVKCIYIDPPFNTGSAFTHYDDGLEHSMWLSLMRPRLEYYRSLLSNNGALFIHIDYNEEAYLRVLCDEVFGRANFRNTIIVSRVKKSIREREYVKALNYAHDTIVFYAKSDECLVKPPMKDVKREERWHALDANGLRTGMDYELFGCRPPTGRHWMWSYERAMKAVESGDIKPHPKTGKPIYRIKASDSEMLDTNWTDLQSSAFNWNFPNGEKNEKLIQRIFEMTTSPGDLVLDSFLGSGTTAAVAHKMNRRWIGIELGDHAYTHCYPRLKAVVDGEQGGISKAVGWQGGGGFKFYELAPSLLEKGKHGILQISDKYNEEMLAQAMAKHEGYTYAPDADFFWKQGFSGEGNYIFTTTGYISPEYLDNIASQLSEGEYLLICAESFDMACIDRHKSVILRPIPRMLLGRCEWGKDNYDLNVILQDSDEWGDDDGE